MSRPPAVLSGLSAVPAPMEQLDAERLCCRLDLATLDGIESRELCRACRERRRRLLAHTCPDCGALVLPRVLRDQGRCTRCADPDPLY